MSKMNFNDYGRCMATYNSWQNGVLFDLCDQIGDVERRLDRNMFFGSIHNTLNHILYVDLRILTILRTGEVGPFEPTTIVADDFETLKAMRAEVDADITEFVEGTDHSWQDEIRELPFPDGVTRKLPDSCFWCNCSIIKPIIVLRSQANCTRWALITATRTCPTRPICQ